MWTFLIIIGLGWLIFGSFQDWKSREISDWVTLSLVSIGLGVRTIFAIAKADFGILSLGLLSTVILMCISFIFYYTKVFAGGDFKLLTGLGPFVPGISFESTLYNSAFSIVALLLVGFLYSFCMGFLVALKNKHIFKNNFKKNKKAYLAIIPALMILITIMLYMGDMVINYVISVLCIALAAYPFLLSVDACMIKRYLPSKLTAGDWLVSDVNVRGKVIKASVHGLSKRDISFLQKYHKSVLVKEGIPFVPAFLITFAVMVFVFAVQGVDFFAQLLAAFL